MKVDVFEVREDRTYSSEHVWAKDTGEDVTLGLDDFSQKMLEFVESVELPEPGTRVSAGQQLLALTATRRVCHGGLCTIERNRSVVASPLSGVVVQVNDSLGDSPDLLQLEPYDAGWIAVVRPDGEAAERMLDAQQMKETLEREIAAQPDDIIERVRAAWSA